MHRVTGLGVLLFLVLHVIDTSWAVFFPELYVKAIAEYQSPIFTLGEFALVFAVVYHAFNGLRIIIFDFRPDLWRYQQQAAMGVVIATVVVLVPVFLGMFGHVLEFYSGGKPVVFSLDPVLAQWPFAVGIIAAALVALALSGVYGAVVGEQKATELHASQLERLSWSFMRISGLLIIPLVFVHLALMHITQGVFDITAANHPVVGTLEVNTSGTAVEFVKHRWSYVAGGLYLWKVWDILLLSLVILHGFNGLRFVLTDYTTHNSFLRRAMNYLIIISIVVYIVIGGAAILGTITNDAVTMAERAMAVLDCERDVEAREDCEAVLSGEDEVAPDATPEAESGD
jgi:succinate dehydrogenase / fumarate reductase cytochrome b subunit